MVTNTEFADRTSKYLSFIAPHVHDDTQSFFEHATVSNRSEGINFGSYNIGEFINVTQDKKNFDDMKQQTEDIVSRFMASLTN